MMRTILLALVLLGCGEGGGGGAAQAPSEAPLCEPPAGLACPDGMREERVEDEHGEGVFCWEGDTPHALIRHRDGQVYFFSPPPFDTVTGCWPVAVAKTAGVITIQPATSKCWDAAGNAGDCQDIVPAMSDAWGFTE